MARHTSFGVGGPAEGFFTPATVGLLADFIRWAKKAGVPYRIIGGGTNLLASDGGIEGMVISLKALRDLKAEEGDVGIVTVRAMAGARLQVFCQYAARNGLEGMNFAVGIPGTIGGGIMMNAGTGGRSMADALISVTIMDANGDVHDIGRENFEVGYRSFFWNPCLAASEVPGAVLLAGTFQLRKGRREARELRMEARERLLDRRRKQPIGLPSAGCFFKNPPTGPGAGELIDRAGLKGRRIGDAEVSTKHANFIVNRGNASSMDILELAGLVQRSVFRKFGTDLEPEVRIIE